MVRDIRERFELSKLMVVSPDAGGVVARAGLPSASTPRCASSTSAGNGQANPKS